MRLLFDIETPPFDEERLEILPDLIWCGVAHDLDTNEVFEAGPGDIDAFAALLAKADLLAGHNIATFDIPILEKLYPQLFDGYCTKKLLDTLVVSRMSYPELTLLKETAIFRDKRAGKRASDEEKDRIIPAHLMAVHSLEAWGYRLDMPKKHADAGAEFFLKFSPEMLERCRGDVALNVKLLRRLTREPARKKWPQIPVKTMLNESRVAYISARRTRTGIGFNEKKAQQLDVEITGEQTALLTELRAIHPTIVKGSKAKRGKKQRVMRKGLPQPITFLEGAAWTPVKSEEWKPGSPEQTARILMNHYGWEPQEFTDSTTPWKYAPQSWKDRDQQTPSVTKEVMADLFLQIPLTKQIARFNELDTVRGMLSGTNGWLALVRNGRIHGRINVNGARTGRKSHSEPNLANIPKNGELGQRCRALFYSGIEGWLCVGADADALELRMLANRMFEWDGGAFFELVTGKKPNDVHTVFMKITGLMMGKVATELAEAAERDGNADLAKKFRKLAGESRDNQKRVTYGMIYGAGDGKLGLIFIEDWQMGAKAGLPTGDPPDLSVAAELGSQVRAALMVQFPALEQVFAACKASYKSKFIVGLDGRIVPANTEHGVLNDLLQGDGAQIMKRAETILEGKLLAAGWRWGIDYIQMIDVHDEFLMAAPQDREICAGCRGESEDHMGCRPQRLGEMAAKSIEEAGVFLGVKVPLAGTYHIGADWQEVH